MGPARRNRRMSCDFKERLQKAVKETEAVVYEYLPAEEGYQKTIFSAMNYSVKAGGERRSSHLWRRWR